MNRLFFGILFLTLFSCALKNDFTKVPDETVRTILQKQSKHFGQSSQLVLAFANDSKSNKVRVIRLEKLKDQWVQVGVEVEGLAGKKNFAELGEKIEGDLKTPSGVYGLSLVFGYEKNLAIKMPYRQATSASKWVYDIKSKEYNLWVEGETKSYPYEEMKRNDDLYKYGIVIDYNFNPIIPGKGSAIFFHIMEEGSIGTAGCIATKEADVLELIKWLDPDKHPKIILGTQKILTN